VLAGPWGSVEDRFDGGGRGGLVVVDGGASEGPAEVVEGGADMVGGYVEESGLW
jgi:hypothetical protein